MAAAAFASPRPAAASRLVGLAPDGGCHRPDDAVHRVARVPLVLPQCHAEYPPQFRQPARRRVPGRRWVPRRRRRLVRWRRSIGELVMSISAHDHERISAAIHAAEAKTSGEIVCLLAPASSDATALPILVAALVALALPWPIVAFTAMPVNWILVPQLLAFVALAAPLCLPRDR